MHLYFSYTSSDPSRLPFHLYKTLISSFYSILLLFIVIHLFSYSYQPALLINWKHHPYSQLTYPKYHFLLHCLLQLVILPLIPIFFRFLLTIVDNSFPRKSFPVIPNPNAKLKAIQREIC
ncbi:hypothetical protein V6Z12_D03G161700 [Gossypium hirsutum]